MNGASEDLPQLKPATARLLRNVSLLILALFPLFFSCLVRRAFAPLDGFCPLDIFHVHQSPSAQQLLWWRYGSTAAYIALAALAVFQRPLAVTLLVLTSLSPVLLFLRFVEMLGHIE
jgi:hypothetical protein